MAGTFAINVKKLWNTNLPQAGQDSTGASKNVKQQVAALVTITYADTSASFLYPKHLGLRTIDHISIEPVSSGANVVTASADVKVTFAHATNVIYGTTVVRSTGAETETVADTALVFRVLAVGDSAAGVEQL